MVIDDREFLWEKIKKCEGKNPKFEYVEGTLSYMGQTYITVEIFDGKSENGGFAVKKIGSKWYLEDWLGEVYCSD